MDNQKFCLRWNSFQRSLTSVFEHLRQDEELVDITLCCEGKKIKAHRMMLSACSPYFRDLLKENPCQHPLVFLKDTSYVDMAAVVEFVYKGEVNVLQSQLASFLRTAETLQVRGLSGDDDAVEPPAATARQSCSASSATPPTRCGPPQSAGWPSKRPRVVADPAAPPVPLPQHTPAAQPAAQQQWPPSAVQVKPEPVVAEEQQASLADSQPREADLALNTPTDHQGAYSGPREALNTPTDHQGAYSGPGETLNTLTDHQGAYSGPRETLNTPTDHQGAYSGPRETLHTPTDHQGAYSGPREALNTPTDHQGAYSGPRETLNTPTDHQGATPGRHGTDGGGGGGATDEGGAQMWECAECGRQYRHRFSYQSHLKVHRGATTCRHCGRVYARVSILNEHLEVAHGVPRRRYNTSASGLLCDAAPSG